MLDIVIKPSKVFLSLLGSIILASILILCLINLSLILKLLLISVVIAYGYGIFWQHGVLRHAKSIQRIRLMSDGWVIHNQITSYPVMLSGSSTMTRFVCVLNFKTMEKNVAKSCVIFKDSIEKDAFRRLSVYARNSPKT